MAFGEASENKNQRQRIARIVGYKPSLVDVSLPVSWRALCGRSTIFGLLALLGFVLRNTFVANW
jgi:hypothetical protein